MINTCTADHHYLSTRYVSLLKLFGATVTRGGIQLIVVRTFCRGEFVEQVSCERLPNAQVFITTYSQLPAENTTKN